jgi:hypothetical protein
MNLMLTKTPPEDIKQHILPVVYNALDAESSQVQVCGRRRSKEWK